MKDNMAKPDKTTKPSDIVATAKKRFERAKSAYAQTRQLAVEDTRFAMGDSDNGWQWPEDIRNTRKVDKRVCLTVNLTAQHCNQIINNIRQNRPAVKVSPADNYADKKTAEILGGLIRNIQVSSAADDAHDVAAEHGVYGGEGYWRVVTEYESDTSFDQVIKIKACPNPQLVYIDPDCKEQDKSDAQWGFVFEDITKDECNRDHPDIDPESWGEEARKMGWCDGETIRRAEYFYCTYIKETACLCADGSTYLKSNLPEGAIVIKERPTEVKSWKWCKLIGGHDAPIDETEWLGDYLPIVAVVGKELNVNGEVIRKGIVRDLKDPARMVNFSYSETVQTLALQNKVPYMAAAEAIEGYENIWKSANLENRAYLPFNAYDDEGKQLPRPERQAPAVMPAAQVQLLQLSTEQMRAASGQQNSNFGIKSEASSGVGIQRLKVQGETATFHFPDNLARALRYEAKVLINLIQKYYDTARVVRILGLDGKEETAHLQPEMEQPYHEVSDEEGEIQRIFNPLVGTYDVTIDTGPAYQTQRQESFAALSEIASRNPQLMQVAGDLIMRSADFPMADQLAERLAKTLPPELQDKKPGQQAQIPPEVQQHVQQLEQQAQQMDQALQQAQGELQQAKSGVQAKQVQAQMDAEAKIQAARLDAQVSLEKANLDAQTKIQIAQINIHAESEIEEMRGYFELQKAQMAPPSPGLIADVEQEFQPEMVDSFVKPKRTRKRVSMMAPSGQMYHGTIEDEEVEEPQEYVEDAQ
jgi:hypothetical protein